MTSKLKLFLVHLGYYAPEFGAVFEQHTNVFVVAEDAPAARKKAKAHPDLAKYGDIHVDGVLEVERVDNHDIKLVPAANFALDYMTILHATKAPGWVQKP